MNAKVKKVSSIVLNVILWLFFAFALAMTIFAIAAQNDDGVPSIGGKCYLNVLSDSMKPEFKKGDLIVGTVLSNEDKKTLKEGDIISFYADLDGDGNQEINSHRIVGINTDSTGRVVSYVTKGDNNQTNDKNPVICSYVICVWQGGKAAGIGSLIGAMQQPAVFLCVIVLPLVLVFAYEIFCVIRSISKIKNAGKRQITAADEELIKQRAIEEYIKSQQQAANTQTTVDNSSDSATGDVDTTVDTTSNSDNQ